MAETYLSESQTQKMYKILYSLNPTKNIRKGINETIKAIKQNQALLVIVATDTVPFSIIGPIPLLCELQSVDLVYVKSKEALGRACNSSVSTAACAILTESDDDVADMTSKIKKAMFS
ncbi:hypothetical protein ENBRE01_0675 [Enteropsectra breve]|nr:hypothetical protein ENBRE01_0675 [Enteropsectra breve]